MGKVVGIDLGTTNSVVAVLEGGKPVVIANAEGMRTTPSVVAFTKDGERLVGQMARRQAVLNPQNTFYGVKRFIGRKYAELNPELKRVPYTIQRDELNGNIKIKCPRLQKDFAPEELSAMVLRKLVEDASRYLGEPVTKAVITVPAYFNDAQRQATRDAGRIAGLEVLRILNEPTAASLAYGLDRRDNETILVFDLGGGTFDVSILDIGDGVFEVKATSGDSQLGGSDFDRRIVDWLADQFQEKQGIDLRRDRQALQRLMEAAEKAKIELSGVISTEINLPFIAASEDEPLHLETRLTRTQFEELCVDLINRMRQPVRQAFSDSGLSPNRIDEVVLVGGGSRMPMVRELVQSMIDLDLNETVNPDEVVAVGAAIQGAILNKEVQDILLLDVTPLSLGLETVGGLMKKLIPRNTTIPVRRSDIFSTSENNQTMVEIHVVQGEREMASDNKSLGRFKLMGIPPAPRGIPQISVSLDIDANGILQVTALDRTTGREQGITIQGASNLSDAEVDRMIEEAERFADQDRQKRDRIEKRTNAEALTFEAERQLREVALDFGMQFASAYRRRIENLIQELRDNLKRNDDRGIDITQADLRDALYELQREVYQLTREDEEDKDFFGSIRRTLSNLGEEFFGDDDDFYDDRRDYGRSYGSEYGRDTYAQDSWGRRDYDRDVDRNYGRDRYAQNDWNTDRDAYNRDTYNRDSYNRDSYSRDTSSRDTSRDNYNRDNSSRDSYGREGYSRDPYSRDGSRDNYSPDTYSRRDSGSGSARDYRDNEEYRGRTERRDGSREANSGSYSGNLASGYPGSVQDDYRSSSERRNSYRDENSDARGAAADSAGTPRRADSFSRSDDAWDDEPRTDRARTGSPRADSPRADGPRADAPRADGPRTDSPRPESRRTDSPRTDSPRPDSSRDSSRTDSPRIDPDAPTRRRSSEAYPEEPASRRPRDSYAGEPTSRRGERDAYAEEPSPRRPRTSEGEARGRGEADFYAQPSRSSRSDPNADLRDSGNRRVPIGERASDRRPVPPNSYNNALDDEWGDEDEWL